MDDQAGIRIVAKAGALLCAAVLLALHFWVPAGDSSSVAFLIALLFLCAIALSG